MTVWCAGLDETASHPNLRMRKNQISSFGETTSPFKSAGASVQSTTGSRGVRISGSNAGYTMFRGSVKVLATHSIRQFPLRFLSSASPCAITFQLASTTVEFVFFYMIRTTARDDFPTQLSPIGLSDVNPPCSL